jgi:hypothetical protein
VDPIIKNCYPHIFPIFDAQSLICANFELRMTHCLEAYGVIKGKEKCEDIISDLHECIFHGKKSQRVALMRRQHESQYKNGERKELFSKVTANDHY